MAQIPSFMTSPDEAMTKIDASLTASFDKALVDNQPMAAVFIAQSPLIAKDSEDYLLDLKLGKAIELNGKPMSFSELQMLIFSSMPF